MRREEAVWVGDTLAGLDVEQLSPLLELGSSTLRFRTKDQPHIDEFVHAPLRRRGVQTVHSDLRAAEGVDVAGDIYDPETFRRLQAAGARAILCCNMFEHVTDRQRLASRIVELAPGGLAIITVPHSYPLHLDPIDTYFRPSPAEIAALFPGGRIVAAAEISSTSYGQDWLAGRGRFQAFATQLWRLLAVWVGPRRWCARNHRLLWLFRPYVISGVVIGLADE